MSLTSLAMVVGVIAVKGVVREVDEGTPAHIFQLLIALQVPIVTWFAVRWLPDNPRPALRILAMQVGAGVAACAPVFYYGL